MISLLNNLQSIIRLTEAEKALVEDSFSPRLYRKKQHVLQENDLCKYLYFVETGCLRMYTINEKGNLYIVKFAPENVWITNFDSFYSETPSAFAIDALEDTTVWQIHLKDLCTLYEKAKFNRIFRVLIERAYIGLQQRVLQNISGQAVQRYAYFAKTHPELVNRLPQTQIAAYLGITPVSLSNAKSEWLRNN